MKGETPVFRGLKCFGASFSFLVNMLVMTPLPAGGEDAFVSGNLYFTMTGFAMSSTHASRSSWPE